MHGSNECEQTCTDGRFADFERMYLMQINAPLSAAAVKYCIERQWRHRTS